MFRSRGYVFGGTDTRDGLEQSRELIEDIDSMPASCRSYFLNTLDGATSKEGMYLIGTTNYPEKIDPALMNRAGRFENLIYRKGP